MGLYKTRSYSIVIVCGVNAFYFSVNMFFIDIIGDFHRDETTTAFRFYSGVFKRG